MKKLIFSREIVYYLIPVEVPDNYDGTAQEFLDEEGDINYDDYISGYDYYEVDGEEELEDWGYHTKIYTREEEE